LLVEDDPTILGMTKKILEMRRDTVFPANTPAEAVKISESHKGEIDLLLTDVVMPHMNVHIKVLCVILPIRLLYHRGTAMSTQPLFSRLN